MVTRVTGRGQGAGGRRYGKRLRRQGQVVVELTLAVTAFVILLSGILVVWSWLLGNIVERQRAYERTRVEAATPSAQLRYQQARMFRFVPRRLSVWGD